MSEALYERYKDALRRGHVAAMRDRLEAALAAYVEAATIAPERALPHASIGSVYLRMDRPAEALVAYDAAFARAPGDEAVLGGRADALLGVGRRTEAAEALDRLVMAQEAAGRLADACDTARRALELAESRTRRRAVEGLVARLRESPLEGPAAEALARALHLLEETVVARPEAGGRAAGARAVGAPDREPPAPAEPTPPRPDPLALVGEAEAAIDAGDVGRGRATLLEAADIHASLGHLDAALDACYRALAVAPADPDLHLALAGLYLERGWRAMAAEKLLLLDRLADLGGDVATRARVRELAARRLVGEPRARTLLEAPATG